MPKQAGDSDVMENSDSDDLPSGLDDSDEAIQSDLDESADDANVEGDESDSLSLAEGTDNDDLFDLDDDLPDGLIGYDGSDAENGVEEEECSTFGDGHKRKRAEDNNDRRRRKKLRSLPTFASYEDYAKMIEEGPEDDI